MRYLFVPYQEVSDDNMSKVLVRSSVIFSIQNFVGPN